MDPCIIEAIYSLIKPHWAPWVVSRTQGLRFFAIRALGFEANLGFRPSMPGQSVDDALLVLAKTLILDNWP